MPTTTEPRQIAETTFRALGTTIHVLATDPRAIEEAEWMTRRHLADLDAAASRFRPDSEVSVLASRAGDTEVSTFVSPLLAEYLSAALHAARVTDGLVDPTVGRALEASGYDADIEEVRRRPPLASDPVLTLRRAPRVPGWESVGFDETTRYLTVPAGTLLDLGASAKAHAADRIAAALAGREAGLPGGFLVNLGGDIATSGPVPEGGWPIGVEDASGRVVQAVLGTGHAFATSSTRRRTWAAEDGHRHHIVDPRTGRTAQTLWAQVTCAAATALEANAAATAAIVLGASAPGWLAGHGIPARLDTLGALGALGGGTVTTPGWPSDGGGPT
jgi:thiamine biosynthesis lipoprotein